MYNKIKALLALKGLNLVKYAECIGISKSSLSTKAKHSAWTFNDIIKLAELTNTKIIMCDKDTGETIITFDSNDLKASKNSKR